MVPAGDRFSEQESGHAVVEDDYGRAADVHEYLIGCIGRKGKGDPEA